MTRLELRALIAAILAATVILGAVMCAAYGQAAIAAALAIYALGVGAWLYHSIERLVLARRIETVRDGRHAVPAVASGDGRDHGVDPSGGAIAVRRHRGRATPLDSDHPWQERRRLRGLSPCWRQADAAAVSEILVWQLWQSGW